MMKDANESGYHRYVEGILEKMDLAVGFMPVVGALYGMKRMKDSCEKRGNCMTWKKLFSKLGAFTTIGPTGMQSLGIAGMYYADYLPEGLVQTFVTIGSLMSYLSGSSLNITLATTTEFPLETEKTPNKSI